MGTGTVELGSAPALAWMTILLDASIKGAVILLIAAALSALLRRTSAAARHLVWLLAVASLIALPVLSLALPAWRLPILPQELAAVEPVTTPMTETSALSEAFPQLAIPPEPLTVTPLVSIAESLPEPESAEPTHWSAWLLIIWGTGAMAVFLWLLAGTVSVWRTARRAEPVPEGSPWAVLLKELAGRLGVKGAARLLQSEGVSVPMIWGLVRPLVLLPADGERWSEERRRIVLLHELAHIRRKDCLTQMVAQLACTIYWFNPLAWLAARQMRRERERACDDLVLSAGLKASSYAGHLLEIARSARSLRWAAIAGVAMARPSNIEGRLLAILDAKRSRRALTRLTIALALIAVTCALLPLAAIRPVATAAEEESGTQDQRVERRLYDIRDLLRRPGEGELTAEQLKENGEQFAGSLEFMFETDFAAIRLDQRTGKPAPLPTIAYREGNLDVRGTPAQHQRIADSLESIRTNRRFSVELDVQAFVIDRATLPAEHRELLSRRAPEAVVKTLLRADLADFKDLAPNIPDIKLVATARVTKTGWLDLQPVVASSVKWQRKAHVPRSQGPPTPIDGLLGTTVSTGVLTRVKDAYVDLHVVRQRVNLLNLPATVPDRGILVALEEGATARAVAAVWMGEEAAKRLNIEDCLVVLLARPRIVAQQELDVALPHSVPSKLGLEGRVHLRGELQVGGPTARPPIARQLGPWKKQLANGAVVEILGAGRLIDDKLQWWGPDGSPTRGPDIVEADVEDQGTVLAVRMSGSEDRDFQIRMRERGQLVKPDLWYSGSGRMWMLVAGDRRFITLRFEVASGPWRTLTRIPLRSKDVGREVTAPQPSVIKQVTDLKPLTADSFEVTIQHKGWGAWSRFAALDNAGKAHGHRAGSFWKGNAKVTFALPIEGLAAIVYQERLPDTVEFRNVRIAPPTWLEPAKVVSPVQRGATAPRSASQPVHAADPALGSRGVGQGTVAAKSQSTLETETAAEIHVRLYEFSGPFPKQVTEHLGLAPVEGGMIATVLTGAKLRTLVDALKVLPDVQLVWSPKLTLNDTQRSQLATPTHENFVKDVRRVTKDGEERIEPVIETFTWGRLLDARPTISSDRRFVELEFGFTDSRLLRFDTKEKLGHRIQVPVLETTELKTAVNIPSGGAVALSGLRLGEGSLLLVISADVVEPSTDTGVPPMVLRAEPAFGPVIERVVNDPDWSEKDAGIDLDTGTLFSTPAGEFGDDLMAAFQWTVAEGIDAVSDSSGKALRGLGMVVKAVPNERWDAITPEEVAADADLLQARTRSPLTPIEMHTTTPPATYLFRTREGGAGILQITGFTAGQRGVKIRYKMLQATKPEPATGQVIELVVHDDDPGSACLLDIDTGKVLVAPEDITGGDELEFMRKHGVDAVGETNIPGLGCIDMKVVYLGGKDAHWELEPDVVRPQLARLKPGRPGERVVMKLPGVYAFETREGSQGLLQVLAVDRENIHVRYKMLQTRPVALPGAPVGEVRKAFIPDADTRGVGVVLDLASGEMLPAPASVQGERFMRIYRRLGKGDLIYDRELICLRGATARRREADQWVALKADKVFADFTAYELPPLPCRLLVTTGDGIQFDVTVLSGSQEGIDVEYRKAQAPATAKGETVREKLQRIVTFSFAETPLEVVVDFLRTVGEVSIVVDQRVMLAASPRGYRVSLSLTDVPLEDALDFITDLVDLKWTIRRGVVFISDATGVQAEPDVEEKKALEERRKARAEMFARDKALGEKLQREITFSFVDTPLEDVVEFLRRVGDVSMVVDQRMLATVGPGGYRITLSLTDIPLEDALDFITDLVDLKWTVRRGTVFISDAKGLQAGAEERKALEERRKARVEMIAREKPLGEKLQRIVTFSFADTPLEDVADFLRRVGDVSMVVDQRVLAAAGPGGYRITLSLTDIPLEDALDFIVDLLDLEWTIRRGGVFISDALGVQAEPGAEERGPLAELRRKRGALAAAEKAVLEKFQREVTFTFADTPLEDVADFLRRVGDVNIVVDQRVLAAAGPGGYRITLSVTDIPLEDALDFILDLVDLEWTIRRGVVFISDLAGVMPERFMRIYDVRDIIGVVPNLFDSLAPSPVDVGEAELKAAEEKAEALVKRIQEEVEPETWKLERTSIVYRSIVYRQGNLIVRQIDDVHLKIQRFLEGLHRAKLFSIRRLAKPEEPDEDKTKMVNLQTGEEVWVSNTLILTAVDLAPKPEVEVAAGGVVKLEMTPAAARRLKQWTGAQLGERLALVADGEVWSAATIKEAISGEGIVLVAPDAERAQRFARKLQDYFDHRLKEGRRSP